jgi:acetyl-CoA carboxylase carboxyl transferase subunit beta
VAGSARWDAEASYEAGDLSGCRAAALDGLESAPDDVDLLRLAGRASAQLGLADAVRYLRRLLALEPDEVEAWRDLGRALVGQGDLAGATTAFRRAQRLRSDDSSTLVDLAHVLAATGNAEEAATVLSEALERNPGGIAELRSLVDVHRQAGKLSAALERAAELVEAHPDDVLAILEVADQHLTMGNFDGALTAFQQLRQADSDDGHEVYAIHGMVEAELRRKRWRPALHLAIDATRLDRVPLTTDLLAFASAQLFGERGRDQPAPTWDDLQAALATERAEHRRLHAEAQVEEHLRGPSPTAAPERPAVQWIKCPACEGFVYYKRLERNLKVCPECSHHFRLSARDRLAQLLDPGSFNDLSGDVETVDVLGFADSKPYTARLDAARKKTGSHEAAVYGTATIEGQALVVAAMDFPFMGGSMGGAVGEIITRAAELALERRTPLLLISASGGARMQEGGVSLMQLAKTSQAIARLHEEGILCLCLNTDPTFGGVTASFAMLGDALIAEPSALIGFAGPNIIQQTIRQQLPAGFQTAEFLLDHGMLDFVEPRENLKRLLEKLIAFHSDGRSETPKLPPTDGRPPITDPDRLAERPAWELVELARQIDRPTTLEYIGAIFDDFLEFHGDRLFRENPSIVGGLARLGDLNLVVVGHQKGHSTSELVTRNFGMPQPEGYRKALRLMRYAAKFRLPLVTLVDTPGAYPGIEAEERGQGVAIATGIMEMARLPVPIVTVVTGEGGSGGALALAVGNRVLMMENAFYSVISPEGCSVILWSSAGQAPAAAAALRVTARDLLRLKVVDGVVPEPEGGAHLDHVAAAANLKTAIVDSLNELLPLGETDLLEARYRRFRLFGTPGEQPVLT